MKHQLLHWYDRGSLASSAEADKLRRVCDQCKISPHGDVFFQRSDWVPESPNSRHQKHNDQNTYPWYVIMLSMLSIFGHIKCHLKNNKKTMHPIFELIKFGRPATGQALLTLSSHNKTWVEYRATGRHLRMLAAERMEISLRTRFTKPFFFESFFWMFVSGFFELDRFQIISIKSPRAIFSKGDFLFSWVARAPLGVATFTTQRLSWL